MFNHLDPNASPPSTPEEESTTGPVVAMTTDGGDGDEEGGGGEGTCFNCYLLCLALSLSDKCNCRHCRNIHSLHSLFLATSEHHTSRGTMGSLF